MHRTRHNRRGCIIFWHSNALIQKKCLAWPSLQVVVYGRRRLKACPRLSPKPAILSLESRRLCCRFGRLCCQISQKRRLCLLEQAILLPFSATIASVTKPPLSATVSWTGLKHTPVTAFSSLQSLNFWCVWCRFRQQNRLFPDTKYPVSGYKFAISGNKVTCFRI